jgi:putative PIN family toxin of toxin-antitoxin system
VRVIVDTNVFVSGLINPGGAPGVVVGAALDGRVTPVFSIETLAELRDVLV